VDDLGELPSALDSGTGLIEVVVDRASNVALHARIAIAVDSALGRGREVV